MRLVRTSRCSSTLTRGRWRSGERRSTPETRSEQYHILYRPGFDWGIKGREAHTDGSEFPAVGPDPVRDHQEPLRRELGFVLAHPGLVVSRIPEKMGAFWNPTSFVRMARLEAW